MHIVESAAQEGGIFEHLGFLKGSMFLHILVKVAAVNERHDHIDRSVCLEHLHHLDNVGMVQAGKVLCLRMESAAIIRNDRIFIHAVHLSRIWIARIVVAHKKFLYSHGCAHGHFGMKTA